jgi:NTE family protein
VELGYQTALMKIDSLKMRIGDRRVDTASLNMRRRAFRAQWPPFRFSEVELSGLNEKQALYVEKSIRKKDEVIGINAMKKEYLKLANDKSLTYLYPSTEYNSADSLYTFRLRIIPEAPLEARFGMFISTTGHAQTYLGVSYREIQELSMHLKGSLQFGRMYDGVNLGFRFDYPSRIPLYFKGAFNYNHFDHAPSGSQFFFEDLKPAYIKEHEINVRFDLGMPLEMNNVLSGGIGIGRDQEIYYMRQDFTTEDTSEVSLINLVSLYVAIERNTLNNKQFATEGTFRKLSLRTGYGRESYIPGSTSDEVLNRKLDYFWLSARLENTGYIPLRGAFSLGYHYVIQATFRPLLSNYYSSIIEAPVFQPTLISRSLFMEKYRAHQFIGAGIMPVYNIGRRMHLKMEAYGFFPVQEILRDEYNKAYLGTYFGSMKFIGNASVNVVTVAGPVGLHLGYFSAQEKPWILQLSFGYLLFNRKSAED